MSNESSAIMLERIDHGVLPSNDLGRAFRFWSDFMGARLGFHANLNRRGLNREVPIIVFFTVANHAGFGLALQDFPLSPVPARPLEGVVWGFEVAADDLSAVVDEAEKRKLRWQRDADYPSSSPLKESLFVLDPDGNTVELCIRKKPATAEPQAGPVPLRRISHVRIEATDLEQARSWYGETFGMITVDQAARKDQLTLTIPKSEQLVIIHRVAQVAERSTQCFKGPHIDLRSNEQCYPEILKRFNRRETYWGPDPHLIPWHEPDANTAYGYDPFGNRIQIGIIAKRPMHFGEVTRFANRANV
ncbi:MAG TPA: VOC family protein [Candidatus Binatia bacterium]|nr:VOC family protein [Candidatus Binatia bacterium]